MVTPSHITSSSPFAGPCSCIGQLDLRTNRFGDEGARAIANVLPQNRTLRELYIHGNAISDDGALAFAAALPRNETLQVVSCLSTQHAPSSFLLPDLDDGDMQLSIGMNLIGDKGACALAHVLNMNGTLSELHLEENQIGDEGARAFASALRENRTLCHVWLGSSA
ncbi:putative NOD3 protein [Paratrimastix pyriformis]|uniref:NOD3 protein n=1 Tax=Paratrimastix pyriformis TaxID=342808 RepID=A0ABQ8UBF1_9EUKA|nr:putative NOD3 protein [Paratrimastix pyriformis]